MEEASLQISELLHPLANPTDAVTIEGTSNVASPNTATL